MNDKNKKKLIISWTLVVLWAGVIFYLSSRTADQSTVQSRAVIGSFTRILGTVIEDEELLINIDGIVRESAHGVEYIILAILVFYAILETINYKTTEKSSKEILIKVSLYTTVSSFLYAVSDEIHQIPIPGRAFELLDLSIDLIGIVVGVLIALLSLGCLRNLRKKV